MLAGEGGLASAENLLPNRKKLVRNLISFVVACEQAVGSSLVQIAAGDHVDQQSSFREPVEGCRHAGRECRRTDSWTNCHQKFQTASCRHDAGGNDPRIFAKSSGWQQNSLIAEFIHGSGDLPHITQVSATGEAIPKVPTVPAGRYKPKQFHKHGLIIP